MWGHFISKDMVIGPFNYVEKNSYLKILIGRFWGKSGIGGGQVAVQFFGHLKRGLELLISVMSPLSMF